MLEVAVSILLLARLDRYLRDQDVSGQKAMHMNKPFFHVPINAIYVLELNAKH
jgi:hypothetical protein